MILIHHRRGSTGLAGPLQGDGIESIGSPDSAHGIDIREFTPINPFYAALLRVLGPAQCGDNPLAGTKYDAALAAERDRERFERRAAKVVPRWQRRHHLPGVHSSVPGPPDTTSSAVPLGSRREGTRKESSDTIR